jgi:capsular polysaccharide transport system permease protein
MSNFNTASKSSMKSLHTFFSPRPLFVVLVILPTIFAAIYYVIFAAPMYVSEARFVVRMPNRSQPAALGSVLQGVGLGGFGGGDENAYAVHEYVMSRDAVADLEQKHDLRAILSRPRFDFLARFPRPFQRSHFEDLFREYPRFVTVGYDSLSGISRLRVRAFRPTDAANLANALLDGGEGVVNRLNDQANADAVSEAHRQVVETEERVVTAEAALTKFRNREQIIDPARSSLAGLDLVGKLETQLATLKADRNSLASSAPESPQLAVLDRQIAAFKTQIEIERGKMAGDSASLAPKIGEYERLMIERDFAAKELAAVSATLETAREEARRKRLYLQRIVPPNIPDTPMLPMRLLSISLVFVSSLLVYGTVVLVSAGLREHGQSEL